MHLCVVKEAAEREYHWHVSLACFGQAVHVKRTRSATGFVMRDGLTEGHIDLCVPFQASDTLTVL